MKLDIFCWDNQNWDALTYAIYSQKCILLLGPDSALEPRSQEKHPAEKEDDSKPSNEILANKLANDLAKYTGEDPIKWGIDINDLPQVSQYFEVVKSPMELTYEVMYFYKDRKEMTSSIHQNLAKLPFSLVITTSFDNMLLNALRNVSGLEKVPLIDFHNFKGTKREKVEMGSVNRPLIYQLYGSLAYPDSLVISENDFLDLLVRVASGAAPIPDNILSKLTDENMCLLFLGFGFRHWYLRVLLHVLKIGSKRNPSFALEKIDPRSIEEIRRATLFIKHKGSKIQICDAKLTDFAEELVNKYAEKYGEEKPQEPKEILYDYQERPKVFISYVRENEGDVRDLQNKLKEQGLEVLIDHDFLGSGDSWSEKIDQLVPEFDYFILMLSQQLVDHYKTYVYNELKLARKHGSNFKPGLKFILPIRIDNCDIPQYIRDLQVDTIDLRESDSIQKLVKAIRQDCARRKR